MTADGATTHARTGLPGWATKAIVGFVLVLAVIAVGAVLAAFLPRWWAQQAGAFAAGSMVRGVVWGVGYGFVGTVVPLLLLVLAWRARRGRYAVASVVATVVIALIVAAPNLLTLWVVVGTNSAAHAGERILDVDAPGFRGASLAGAIFGVAAFAVTISLTLRYRRRGRQLSELRARAQQGDDGGKGADPDSATPRQDEHGSLT